MDNQNLIKLASEIVSTHVSNNTVAVGDLPNLIQNVHGALISLGSPAPAKKEPRQPAVSIRSSIKPDSIACLECGSKQKMLKRHLQTAHGLSPNQYRQEFGLPASYPLVAPNHAEQRRALAHKIGLGRKRASASEAQARPKRRGRSKKALPPEA